MSRPSAGLRARTALISSSSASLGLVRKIPAKVRATAVTTPSVADADTHIIRSFTSRGFLSIRWVRVRFAHRAGVADLVVVFAVIADFTATAALCESACGTVGFGLGFVTAGSAVGACAFGAPIS